MQTILQITTNLNHSRQGYKLLVRCFSQTAAKTEFIQERITPPVHGLYAPEDEEALKSAKIFKVQKGNLSQQEEQLLQSATSFIQWIAGYGRYSLICGGWVRDKFLKRPCTDLDIATSAQESLIRRRYKVKTTNQNAWIVLLDNNIMQSNPESQQNKLEVTAFRGEQNVSHGVAAARQDAFKRDFTINCLFLDPLKEEVMDFVGGAEDLRQRILRCPGDPVEILRADPLRCLRGARFAAFYKLQFEERTQAAIKQLGHLCSPGNGMEPTRILREFEKLESLDREARGTFAHALTVAHQLGLLKHVLPPNYEDPDFTQYFEQAMRIQSGLSTTTPAELRIYALYKPDIYVLNNISTDIINFFKLMQRSSRYYVMKTVEKFMLLQTRERGNVNQDQEWAKFYAQAYSKTIVYICAQWQAQDVAKQMIKFHKQNRERLKKQIEIETEVLKADYALFWNQKLSVSTREARQKCLDEVRTLVDKTGLSGQEVVDRFPDVIKQVREKFVNQVTRVKS